jgi:hypothetical protein
MAVLIATIAGGGGDVAFAAELLGAAMAQQGPGWSAILDGSESRSARPLALAVVAQAGRGPAEAAAALLRATAEVLSRHGGRGGSETATLLVALRLAVRGGTASATLSPADASDLAAAGLPDALGQLASAARWERAPDLATLLHAELPIAAAGVSGSGMGERAGGAPEITGAGRPAAVLIQGPLACFEDGDTALTSLGLGEAIGVPLVTVRE